MCGCRLASDLFGFAGFGVHCPPMPSVHVQLRISPRCRYVYIAIVPDFVLKWCLVYSGFLFFFVPHIPSVSLFCSLLPRLFSRHFTHLLLCWLFSFGRWPFVCSAAGVLHIPCILFETNKYFMATTPHFDVSARRNCATNVARSGVSCSFAHVEFLFQDTCHARYSVTKAKNKCKWVAVSEFLHAREVPLVKHIAHLHS